MPESTEEPFHDNVHTGSTFRIIGIGKPTVKLVWLGFWDRVRYWLPGWMLPSRPSVREQVAKLLAQQVEHGRVITRLWAADEEFPQRVHSLERTRANQTGIDRAQDGRLESLEVAVKYPGVWQFRYEELAAKVASLEHTRRCQGEANQTLNAALKLATDEHPLLSRVARLEGLVRSLTEARDTRAKNDRELTNSLLNQTHDHDARLILIGSAVERCELAIADLVRKSKAKKKVRRKR